MKVESKIMRKIPGSMKTEEGYRLRPQKETEELSNIAVNIQKKRQILWVATSPGLTRRLPVSVNYLRAPGLIIISPGCVSKIEFAQNYMQIIVCTVYRIGISSYLPVLILYVNC